MLNDIEEMAKELYYSCMGSYGLTWEEIDDEGKSSFRKLVIHNDLIFRLRKRAEIRRQIQRGNGETDRIADLLEEAANALEGK